MKIISDEQAGRFLKLLDDCRKRIPESEYKLTEISIFIETIWQEHVQHKWVRSEFIDAVEETIADRRSSYRDEDISSDCRGWIYGLTEDDLDNYLDSSTWQGIWMWASRKFYKDNPDKEMFE
jgi:hypothetical protein